MKTNREIAEIFSRMADLLEIKGEIPFKVLAYRKAARVLEDLPGDIKEMYEEGRPEKIPGIGEGLSKKIKEYIETKRIQKFDEVKRAVPSGLVDLLGIQGLGPKTIQLAHKNLGVQNLGDLKRAIEDGSLANLFGMGKKKVENILKSLQVHGQARDRIPLAHAMILAEEMVGYLEAAPGIKHISQAGSLRRMKETIGDIDILAAGKNGEKIIDYFCSYPESERVLASGKTKGSVLVKTPSGSRQVDIRIIKPAQYGAALQYFTGSKDHNVKLRSLARDKRLKISEYGVFRGKRKIAGKSEEDVYRALGLPWIPPELREDRGEIEAAAAGGLPDLVELQQVKGDLHVHSNYSDGTNSIAELAERAIGLGYEYIAICDHSQSVKYARGVEPDRLKRQWDEIDKVNQDLVIVKVLKGTEVDVMRDGKLDYPDSILEKLDVVIAAVHQGFKKNVTERLIAAIRHPLVHIIAHPTGRLISKRHGYDVDLMKIFEAAREHGKALELNAFHDRLDLNDINLMKAKRIGIKISIGTDSHSLEGFGNMRLGVATARRGWLEKKHIINCLSYDKLKRFLKKTM